MSNIRLEMNYLMNVVLFIEDNKLLTHFILISKKCRESVCAMKINSCYSKHILRSNVIGLFEHLQTFDGRNRLRKIEKNDLERIDLLKNPNELILKLEFTWNKIESIIVKKTANLLFKNIEKFVQLRRIELWIEFLTRPINKIKAMRNIRSLIIHCTDSSKMNKLLETLKTLEFDRIKVVIVFHSCSDVLIENIKKIPQIRMVCNFIYPLTLNCLLYPHNEIKISPSSFGDETNSEVINNKILDNYNDTVIVSSKYFLSFKLSSVNKIDLSKSTCILDLSINIFLGEYDIVIPSSLKKLSINSINPKMDFIDNSITELHLQNVKRRNELIFNKLKSLELISCQNILFKKVPNELEDVKISSCSRCIIPISSSIKKFQREFSQENEYIIKEDEKDFGLMFGTDNVVVSYEENKSMVIKSCSQIDCSKAKVKFLIVVGSIRRFINKSFNSIKFCGCGTIISEAELKNANKIICETGTKVGIVNAESIDSLSIYGEINEINCNKIRTVELTDIDIRMPLHCKCLFLKNISKSKIDISSWKIKEVVLCNAFIKSLVLPCELKKIVSRKSKVINFINLEKSGVSKNKIINLFIKMECSLNNVVMKISKLKLKNVCAEVIDLSTIHCHDLFIVHSPYLKEVIVSDETSQVKIRGCNDSIIIKPNGKNKELTVTLF